MLGLPGFVLLAVSSAFGEGGMGQRRVRVRDLPSSGRPVTLMWLKRFRCAEPACSVTT